MKPIFNKHDNVISIVLNKDDFLKTREADQLGISCRNDDVPDDFTFVITKKTVFHLTLGAEAASVVLQDVNHPLLHEAWNYAKDNLHLCSEGYDKKAFKHVQWWMDRIAATK